jgi:hypothetical protein
VREVVFNVTGANAIESRLSYASTRITPLADYTSDGQLGESSLTSGITTSVAFFATDPIADFLIDGYGSVYNHGIVPGVYQAYSKFVSGFGH